MLKLASIQIIYMFQVKENKYFDLKKKNALHIKKKYVNLKISNYIGFRCVIFLTFT